MVNTLNFGLTSNLSIEINIIASIRFCSLHFIILCQDLPKLFSAWVEGRGENISLVYRDYTPQLYHEQLNQSRSEVNPVIRKILHVKSGFKIKSQLLAWNICRLFLSRLTFSQLSIITFFHFSRFACVYCHTNNFNQICQEPIEKKKEEVGRARVWVYTWYLSTPAPSQFANIILMKMLWFNFVLGFITIRYHTQKQREIKIKPRIKLNHSINKNHKIKLTWYCANSESTGSRIFGRLFKRLFRWVSKVITYIQKKWSFYKLEFKINLKLLLCHQSTTVWFFI